MYGRTVYDIFISININLKGKKLHLEDNVENIGEEEYNMDILNREEEQKW